MYMSPVSWQRVIMECPTEKQFVWLFAYNLDNKRRRCREYKPDYCH